MLTVHVAGKRKKDGQVRGLKPDFFKRDTVRVEGFLRNGACGLGHVFSWRSAVVQHRTLFGDQSARSGNQDQGTRGCRRSGARRAYDAGAKTQGSHQRSPAGFVMEDLQLRSGHA